MIKLYITNKMSIAGLVARAIVDTVDSTLAQKGVCVLVPSVGRTLVQTYEELASCYAGIIRWRNVICVQMDEYYGVSQSEERSLYLAASEGLVKPLAIGRYIGFFDENSLDDFSPSRYVDRICKLGGVDLAIHGVGENGHIGFNEPASSRTQLQTGIVKLAEETRLSNCVPYTHGVTLGIEVLMEARNSIVVVTGERKQRALASLLLDEISPWSPVTYLRRCRNVSLYVDQEAISTEVRRVLIGGRLSSEFIVM